MKEQWKEFLNPPMDVRAMPLWVWNDKMEESKIRWQLEELRNHGFGGAFVHPRPGLITEYLSEEWFSCWKSALEYAKELGMKLSIYDENSYPSGFGGGKVSAELPDCLAMSVVFSVLSREELIRMEEARISVFGEDTKSDLVKIYTCKQEETALWILEDLSLLPPHKWKERGQQFCLLTKEVPQTRLWMGGFAFVDLLRPEVSAMFLKEVYEPYYNHFGKEFGKSILAVFSDEPYMPGSKIYSEGRENTLPFSYWFAYEFQKEHHYDLLLYLPALFVDVKSPLYKISGEKVRYDFYSTMQRLWIENFIKPVSTWCKEHNIAWTGHFMEHEWPLPFSSPSIMENYVYMDYPGLDLLLSDVLLDKPTHMLLLTFLEIKSVANQLQKQRTLCEIYGAGGSDSTFGDYKRMGDWALVNGINLLNPHLVHGTTVGARKRDHPQTFSWHEPWWDVYTDLNLYQARVAALVSQGKMEQRILVLHPTYTGYLAARMKAKGHLMWEEVPKNPDMEDYLDLLQFLTSKQWDFDLGAEGILESFACIRKQGLKIGNQMYQFVVIPGDMKNMKVSTINLLTEFGKKGGRVCCLGRPGVYVEGVKDEERYEQFYRDASVVCCKNFEDLDVLLEQQVGRRIAGGENFPDGVSHMRRRLSKDEVLYFFVNHSMCKTEYSLILKQGQSFIWLKAFEGSYETIESLNDNQTVDFSMERGEALFFIMKGENTDLTLVPKEKEITVWKTLEWKPVGIVRADSNVQVLDFCDLQIDGEWHKEVQVMNANHLIFQKRGFDKNPWDEAIQYKRRVTEQGPYGVGSGYQVVYHLKIAKGVPVEHIKIAVEKGKCYRLYINDHSVVWADETWMDYHYNVVEIGMYLQQGDNRITLVKDIFDVTCELEAVWILGDFWIGAEEKGGRLDVDQSLHLGAWNWQGHPFYPGKINYIFSVELPQKWEGRNIRLKTTSDMFQATVVQILVNGQSAGLLGIEEGNSIPLKNVLKPGKNIIELKICGSLKNLFGPHHNPAYPRKEAWPKLWREVPEHMPSVSAYDVISYGLMEWPTVEVRV